MIPVPVEPKSLEPYRQLIGDGAVDEIRRMAEGLRGLQVLHINATPVGGGVAEVLSSLVPLMTDLDIGAQWLALDPHPEFFAVTKKIHNGLQGMDVPLSREEIDLYLGHNRVLAAQIEEIREDDSLLVLHDPQVLPAASFMHSGRPVVWHCHIDTSTPNPTEQELIGPLTHVPTHSIVSMPWYPIDGMPRERLSVFPPAIDPFTPKNAAMPRALAAEILAGMGLDTSRPILTQVSRFDPWKDPIGVIDAYRIVKRTAPEVQLALVGAITAQDDPEGEVVLKAVLAYAGDDPDIHIFARPEEGAPEPVNAFQTFSTIVLQKSIREGFGLTVTEAMWKGAAVVGGQCSGIAYQIQDGVNGYLCSNPEECADRVLFLLNDPAERARIGTQARQRVLDDFLMPRLLTDYLKLLNALRQPSGVS